MEAMMKNALRAVPLLLSLAAVACSGGDDGPPPSTDTIVVTGAPTNGKLIPGESFYLDAVVQDSAHQPIGCLYPLKWTNSNPAAVNLQETYPGGAYVYAKALGTAVLSVTCEDLVSTVPVQVVELPADSVVISPDSFRGHCGQQGPAQGHPVRLGAPGTLPAPGHLE